MDTFQKQALTNLRDAFRRNRSLLDLTVIKSYIAYYLDIEDPTLLKKLNTDIAAKAIWYCLCNNNADRDALISKLYDYFIIKGLDESSTLELISMVLFLSGVDFQVNNIERPEYLGQSSSSLRPLSNSNQVKDKSAPESYSTVRKNFKWIVGLALVVVVILAVLLLPRTCSDNGGAGGANSPFSKMDLCRKYNGFIEEGNGKKTCELTISVDFEVTVSNKYKSHDIQKYTASLEGDKLSLKGGPTLYISKDNKGRIKLYYKDKHLKRWDFVSL